MPLNAAQRTHLEKRLRDERALALRIVNSAVSDRADGTEQDRTGDLTKVPFHLADLGTGTNEEELSVSNATRASGELAEIEAALERLYKNPDQFGRCEESGREIPFERLDMIPWARTCDEPSTRSR